MGRKREAALGFSVHTGWTSLVAVALDSAGSPEIIDRRRLELIADNSDKSRFVYHTASTLALPAARKLVDSTTKSVAGTTLANVRAAVTELEGRGFKVARAGMLVGRSRPASDLDAILKSHAAIHTAEGELYRGAITKACGELAIKLTDVPGGELTKLTSARVGMTAGAIERLLTDMKRSVGPPWGQDQKQAMLAAWAALLH